MLTIKESLLQNSPDESLARKAYLLLKNDTEAISISVFTNNYEILELNFSLLPFSVKYKVEMLKVYVTIRVQVVFSSVWFFNLGCVSTMTAIKVW